IAACTTNTEYKMPNGQASYPIDISMAISFMMIQARAEKLGACVVTTYNEADIKDILSVPYSMRVVMLLLIGHPDEDPILTKRKRKSRVVSHEHW
ncbi:MAG: nitroreductase family protein, partial [Spirochaetota bacterium]|nr:nitroreductase family protein [Spirochaetota bacterium]